MLAELYMLDADFDRAKRLYCTYLRKMERVFGWKASHSWRDGGSS